MHEQVLDLAAARNQHQMNGVDLAGELRYDDGMNRQRSSANPLRIDRFERVRMSQKLVPLIGCWALMALWPPAPSRAEGRKVSEAQIQVAISEAVSHLRKQLAAQSGEGEGARGGCVTDADTE